MMRRNNQHDRAAWFNTDHALVDDWEQQRTLRMQRLGEFFTQLRNQWGESLDTVSAAARRHGETLARATISRLEYQRELLPGEDLARSPSLLDVMFLSYYWGHNLADAEAHMLGKNQSLDPSDEARLRRLGVLWQRLSPGGRADVEAFAAFLLSKEGMDIRTASEPSEPVTPAAGVSR